MLSCITDHADAGETGFVYPISSSVYVSGDGKIHFGPAAVAVSIRENNPRRARFDNPKEHLSKAVRETFYAQVLPPEFDPTGSGLTYYEILQAYLAYLTSHTNQAAKQYGYESLLRRRFAIPNWSGEKSEFVKKEMRRILLDAQIWLIPSTQVSGLRGFRFHSCEMHFRKQKLRARVPDSDFIEHAIYSQLLLPVARSRS